MKTAEALRAARTALEEAGIQEARLEAEVLVMHAAERTRESLYASLGEPVTITARERLGGYLERRLQREPLAYITGRREFFGLDFTVDHRVLVPRQDTETLVELALDIARGPYRGSCAIADVGTGSGAIAVSLAANLPKAALYAIDISKDALEVAAANARSHGVEGRVQFLHGDLLTPLVTPVDIIVANLPYIAHGEAGSLQPEVRLFEPPQALFAEGDGLETVARLLSQTFALAQRPRWLVLELGEGQAERAAAIAKGYFPTATVTAYRDLGGMERGLIIGL